jgi:hypothetical protein
VGKSGQTGRSPGQRRWRFAEPVNCGGGVRKSRSGGARRRVLQKPCRRKEGVIPNTRVFTSGWRDLAWEKRTAGTFTWPKKIGVSLNQWIAAAVAEKAGVVETAAEFFKKRAGEKTWSGLMKFLRSAHKTARAAEDVIE